MWVSTFSLMTSQTLNLLFCFRVYHKINGILSKSVIFFFFFIAGVSEKRGKKKRERERERDSQDTGIWRVVPILVFDTDTTPKMACPCNLVHRVFRMPLLMFW